MNGFGEIVTPPTIVNLGKGFGLAIPGGYGIDSIIEFVIRVRTNDGISEHTTTMQGPVKL